MQGARRALNPICWAVVAALLSPIVSGACSMAFRRVHAGERFRVRVMDRGVPVRALRLKLSPSGSTSSAAGQTRYALTDEDGYARFADVRPGSYFLTPEHDGGMADGVSVEVSPIHTADATIPLSWPETTPITVREVRGTLRLRNYYPSENQAPLSLSLLEGISARVIGTTDADSKGRFAFAGEFAPGIYFIRLNSEENGGGMVTIEVRANAKQDGLDLNLGWTGCGLVYSERRSYPELVANKLCGDVVDAGGAVIPDAVVSLLAKGDGAEVIDQTHSDKDGKFAPRQEPVDTYRLFVKSRGFYPFLRVIRIDAAVNSDGCPQPIRVQLEIGPN
jgi:hypothetical protein